MRRWALLVVLAAQVSALLGQSFTGTIEGIVQDSSGGIIAKARVTAVNIGTGQAREFESNTSGRYVFASLPPGSYRLTAAHPSFKTTVVDRIVVEVQQTASLNLTLEVGNVTQTVEVK